MAFEEFTHKKRPVSDVPMVSILKQGVFGINQTCYKKYFKDYKYVIMLFDKEENKIGLKPTNNASHNTYTIRTSREGRLTNISAIAFLNHYGIKHDETRSYNCNWNEQEEILEIPLSDEKDK
jgi:hypothetical protein